MYVHPQTSSTDIFENSSASRYHCTLPLPISLNEYVHLQFEWQLKITNIWSVPSEEPLGLSVNDKCLFYMPCPPTVLAVLLHPTGLHKPSKVVDFCKLNRLEIQHRLKSLSMEDYIAAVKLTDWKPCLSRHQYNSPSSHSTTQNLGRCIQILTTV